MPRMHFGGKRVTEVQLRLGLGQGPALQGFTMSVASLMSTGEDNA